ncbi:phosphopantetheine adenylyltransferase [Sinimarinibacterium sp. CAU 1509]|uniref:phosphopantetheine adenylyltransferase n=1 Tax=Sinimarinibacterium sp. CAU 1509 TaxID=2562283 RepID=UPI0010AC5093|nr:phosphopantetheine adenylyltransferase [Sinimarinibacterium sp. CAU 1509]TJY59864.1 phosphopantetheine adenylyltransferase [Sinimarinibacterium sp. CAU 1509]
MDHFAGIVLVLAGFVHLLPAVGVAGRERLRSLYGVELDDPAVLLLMRHRAAMFAAIGLLMLIAALVPSWRLPASLVGLISTAGYCLLAGAPGAWTAPLRRLWWIDLPLAAGLAVVVAERLLRGP